MNEVCSDHDQRLHIEIEANSYVCLLCLGYTCSVVRMLLGNCERGGEMDAIPQYSFQIVDHGYRRTDNVGSSSVRNLNGTHSQRRNRRRVFVHVDVFDQIGGLHNRKQRNCD